MKATEAKKLTNKYTESNKDLERSLIDSGIRNAAEKGKDTISYSGPVSPNTLKSLRDDGYKVEYKTHDDIRESISYGYYTISWK